jgi:hypothetical protein
MLEDRAPVSLFEYSKFLKGVLHGNHSFQDGEKLILLQNGLLC